MSLELNLGGHGLQERNEFVDRKTAKYLLRHPAVSRKKARKYAKVKWSRKLAAERKRTQHVNHIRVAK